MLTKSSCAIWTCRREKEALDAPSKTLLRAGKSLRHVLAHQHRANGFCARRATVQRFIWRESEPVRFPAKRYHTPYWWTDHSSCSVGQKFSASFLVLYLRQLGPETYSSESKTVSFCDGRASIAAFSFPSACVICLESHLTSKSWALGTCKRIKAKWFFFEGHWNRCQNSWYSMLQAQVKMRFRVEQINRKPSQLCVPERFYKCQVHTTGRFVWRAHDRSANIAYIGKL